MLFRSFLRNSSLKPYFPNPRPQFSFISTKPFLRSLVVAATAQSLESNRRCLLLYSPRDSPFPFSRHSSSHPYDNLLSDDESVDRDIAPSPSAQKGASTLHNIDEWKSKLSMLVQNKHEQEVVSREKKDRCDYGKLAAMASSMGLYSCKYGKVVVFSKVPIPNYRSDLDDKRPQREVTLPTVLQRKVDALLAEHLSQKPFDKGSSTEMSFSMLSTDGSMATDEGLFEQHEPQRHASVSMEKILRRKSLQLRDRQEVWRESPEGQQMQEFRQSLPAYKERDKLLKALSKNQVVVISGETGCGKTTQLPQYILESEIEATRGAVCSIICTQPRRISAMTVSERVAAERGEKLGETVGYKIRLEGMKGRDTRLLFCTTGILLRRLLVDRNLKGVTHVIVDEIHERGMNEDFLLIILKDLLPRRPELRLILMSATLNAELFSSYFGGAPMIHIPGFTYPVKTHFLEDVLEMAGYKLTLYNQIDDYGKDKSWKMRKQALRKRKSQIAAVVEDALDAANFKEYSLQTQESLSSWNPDSIGFNLVENVLCHICRKERPGAVLVFMTGWDDINSLKGQLQSNPMLGDPSRVLLLACHGSMASSEQRLIFDKPENGVRKIVLATNMAETSITINDVVFVVDCGKAKETSYDALNNTPCLLPCWISKAAARQRRGRAGRVQPGVCYHLYPRCVYEAFADYQLPELLRTPLQSLCLQIKSIHAGSISEFLSRALQSPELLSVQNAVEYLITIGALDEQENLTVLGRHLSLLPVEPKLGKMLILGAMFNCLDPILTVVAGLSVRDPFLMPFDKKELAECAKSQFSAQDFSDHLTLVQAYRGWKDAEREQAGYDYCWRNFLSSQTLKAIDSLRRQLHFLLKDIGLVDNSTGTCNMWSSDEHLIRAVICAALYPGISSVLNGKKSIRFKTMEDGQVLLYSSSVNAHEQKIPYPWLVFNEKVKVNTVFLRDSTAVSDSILLLFGGDISHGGCDGHLKMFGGYLEFFMDPALADTYIMLKRELDELIQDKLLNPKSDILVNENLLAAVRLLISEDPCSGRFVFGRQKQKPTKSSAVLTKTRAVSEGDNAKNELQTLLARAGQGMPIYKTKSLKNNQFRAAVEFNGFQFIGQPCHTKKLAEKDAAAEALQRLREELQHPSTDILVNGNILTAVQSSVSEDPSNEKSICSRKELEPTKSATHLSKTAAHSGVNDAKNQLQTLLARAGQGIPVYTSEMLRNNQFRASVEFNGLQFIGKPCNRKKLAEKDAAAEALEQMKGELLYPKTDMLVNENILAAERLMVSEDPYQAKLVSGHKELKPVKSAASLLGTAASPGVDNAKNQLQTWLARASHGKPVYKTKSLKNNQFRATVLFNGMQFTGKPFNRKKLAEKDAAAEALKHLKEENMLSTNDTNHTHST